MNILYLFEEIIKNYKALFFDKIKEKSNDGWKIIYNIQGLNYKNTFYPNLKFIFWMDKNLSKLTDDVVTYLYKQNCVFQSQLIQEENFEEQIDNILQEIKNEKTNNDIINFILNGTDQFNSEVKKLNLQLVFDNLAYKPSGNAACMLHAFDFDLSTNDDLFNFQLKCNKNDWDLIINTNKITINLKEIYKTIIEVIKETREKKENL